MSTHEVIRSDKFDLKFSSIALGEAPDGWRITASVRASPRILYTGRREGREDDDSLSSERTNRPGRGFRTSITFTIVGTAWKRHSVDTVRWGMNLPEERRLKVATCTRGKTISLSLSLSLSLCVCVFLRSERNDLGEILKGTGAMQPPTH